jgi:chromate reductase
MTAMAGHEVLQVLAISGSIRRGSCNRRLLEAAVENAPDGMAIHVYDELGRLPHFSEDMEGTADGGPGPEPIRRLRDLVTKADGLLIATPEYNWSIPGVLKNAIDWLSRPCPDVVLAGKAVAIVGASTGAWGTRQAQSVLRHTLTATESIVMPAPTLFVRHADRLFDIHGTLIDQSIKRALADVVLHFRNWIDVVAAPQTPPRAGAADPVEGTTR